MKYIANERGNIGSVLVIVVIAATVGVIIWGATLSYSNRHQQTLTIQDKLVKAGDKSSTYLIFTDQGVYKDSDALFAGKFNSSDVYGSLKVGQRYTCDVMGVRVQFLSWYPNIVSCMVAK